MESYTPEDRTMARLTRQQLLILTILLFLAVLILGCFWMLTIPSPTTGGPAFVI